MCRKEEEERQRREEEERQRQEEEEVRQAEEARVVEQERLRQAMQAQEIKRKLDEEKRAADLKMVSLYLLIGSTFI